MWHIDTAWLLGIWNGTAQTSPWIAKSNPDGALPWTDLAWKVGSCFTMDALSGSDLQDSETEASTTKLSQPQVWSSSIGVLKWRTSVQIQPKLCLDSNWFLNFKLNSTTSNELDHVYSCHRYVYFIYFYLTFILPGGTSKNVSYSQSWSGSVGGYFAVGMLHEDLWFRV